MSHARCLLVLLALVTTGTVPAGAVNAQTPVDDAAASPEQVLATATHYLETLYRFDWDALRELVAEDVVFEDPTSSYFGVTPWRFDDREAMFAFFERSSQGISSSGFEIERSFATAEYAVLTVVYRSEGDGAVLGVPGVHLVLRAPAVTVVRVEGGLVTGHLDHVDYASMMRDVDKQKEGG